MSRVVDLAFDPSAFPQPRDRGRVLVHVIDLDDGGEVRVPANWNSRPVATRGSRVRVASSGRGRRRVVPLLGRSAHPGTYRGLWWVKP